MAKTRKPLRLVKPLRVVASNEATPDTKGKRVQFDVDTWQALDVLAHSRMMTFQELADEAFRDLLRKHGQPYDTRDAFRRSAAKALKEGSSSQKVEDPSKSARKTKSSLKTKRPAKRRAR